MWNGEDFSLFCENEVEASLDRLGGYAGCRAPKSWIRPTATKVAGSIVTSHFDLRNSEYHLSFRPNKACGQPEIARQTEIFIPQIHTSAVVPLQVEHEGVNARWTFDRQGQTLFFVHEPYNGHQDSMICRIMIKLDPSQSRHRKWHVLPSSVLVIFVILVLTNIYRFPQVVHIASRQMAG